MSDNETTDDFLRRIRALAHKRHNPEFHPPEILDDQCSGQICDLITKRLADEADERVVDLDNKWLEESKSEEPVYRTGTAVELEFFVGAPPPEATVVWANGKQTTETYFGNKLGSDCPFQVREGLQEGCVYDVEVTKEFPDEGEYVDLDKLGERVARLEAAADERLCDNCAAVKAGGGHWPETFITKESLDGSLVYSLGKPTPEQARQKVASNELNRLVKAFQACDDEEDFAALVKDEDLTAVGLLSLLADFSGGGS